MFRICVFLCVFGFVAFAGWQIGGKLDSDAIGMAVGMLFGIMAGIPSALMVLAAQREPGNQPHGRGCRCHRCDPYSSHQSPPPQVIVVTGHNPELAQKPHPYERETKQPLEIEWSSREMIGGSS